MKLVIKMEGKILRQLREKANKTQKQVAEELGYHTTTYARWEQDLNNMKFIDVINIAKYYKVSIDYIAGMTEETEEPIGITNDNKIIVNQNQNVQAIVNIAERKKK